MAYDKDVELREKLRHEKQFARVEDLNVAVAGLRIRAGFDDLRRPLVWELWYARLEAIASALAGNRQITLLHYGSDGVSDILLGSYYAGDIAANETKQLQIDSLNNYAGGAQYNSTYHMGFDRPLRISGNDYLVFNLNGNKEGDNLDAYIYMKFIRDLELLDAVHKIVQEI